MATEKRLIEIIECLRNCANNTDCERCSRWTYPCDEHCVDDLMKSAAEELEKFANAVEVVHGQMEEIEPCYIKVDRQCCLCGTAMGREDNYCPNCGAKMDGDGNGC